MQSTTALHLRQDHGDRIHIPLEVRFEIMLALSDRVAASASSKSQNIYEEDVAQSLDDELFRFRRWIENIKAIMPDAEFPRNNLRILDKLDGPVVARLWNVLEKMEIDLSVLSADPLNDYLYGQVSPRAVHLRI